MRKVQPLSSGMGQPNPLLPCNVAGRQFCQGQILHLSSFRVFQTGRGYCREKCNLRNLEYTEIKKKRQKLFKESLSGKETSVSVIALHAWPGWLRESKRFYSWHTTSLSLPQCKEIGMIVCPHSFWVKALIVDKSSSYTQGTRYRKLSVFASSKR